MGADFYRIWLPVSLTLHLLSIPLLRLLPQHVNLSVDATTTQRVTLLPMEDAPTVTPAVKPRQAAQAFPRRVVLPRTHQITRSPRNWQRHSSTGPAVGLPRPSLTTRPLQPGPSSVDSPPRLGVVPPSFPRQFAPREGPLQAPPPSFGNTQDRVLPDLAPPALTFTTNPRATIVAPLGEVGGTGALPEILALAGITDRAGVADGGPVAGVPTGPSAAASAPNAVIGGAFIPGRPSGPITPYWGPGVKDPDGANLPIGSPDDTPDGRGSPGPPPGIAVAPGPGGAGGTGMDLPSSGPKALGGPRIPYPALALEEDLSGSVVVTVAVSTQGTVANADVLRRSESPDCLANAAIIAARQWKFRPAMERGEAVTSTARLKFDFAKETVTVTQL